MRTASLSFTVQTVLTGAALAWSSASGLAAPADYPTAVLADYVYGCLKANGETRLALQRCSCSIDVVASLVPYEKYVEAETALSLGQVAGERTSIFRQDPHLQEVVRDLRRAQAEAEVRCF